MIESISIKNFSIIKDLEINFEPGLNVIYGESGSGKSLILYAISIIFGESFINSLIREGEKKSILTCYTESNCYQRIGSKLNTAVCSIDGVNVPLKSIRAIRNDILQIHSQGEQEELYSKAFQLSYIDGFLKSEIKNIVLQTYDKYNEELEKLQALKDKYEKESKQQEYYLYQIEEIDKVKPFQEDEEQILEEQINNQILLEKSQESLNLVKGRLESILDNYQSLQGYLERIKDLSQFNEIVTDSLLDESLVKELLYKIDDVLSENSSDTNQDDLNNRIYLLQKLKKKLGCKTLKEVIDLENTIVSEINEIENYPEILEEKSKEVEFLEKEYFRFCEILSKDRELVYKEIIVPELIKNLNLLGFDYIDLDVDHTKKTSFGPNGLDDIEFKISFNKGFSTNPIRKIVSGGEASRISLALKLLKNDGRTLILDEIETGLSGETLRKLANSLKAVSQDSQIICISHSEEIIRYADKKIKIFKEENLQENRIETKVDQNY